MYMCTWVYTCMYCILNMPAFNLAKYHEAAYFSNIIKYSDTGHLSHFHQKYCTIKK